MTSLRPDMTVRIVVEESAYIYFAGVLDVLAGVVKNEGDKRDGRREAVSDKGRFMSKTKGGVSRRECGGGHPFKAVKWTNGDEKGS